MSSTQIYIYIVAVFILGYSIRSLVAGIRNEKKSFWMTTRYDGTKEWLKERHDKVWNIILGIVGISIGITLFYLY